MTRLPIKYLHVIDLSPELTFYDDILLSFALSDKVFHVAQLVGSELSGPAGYLGNALNT